MPQECLLQASLRIGPVAKSAHLCINTITILIILNIIILLIVIILMIINNICFHHYQPLGPPLRKPRASPTIHQNALLEKVDLS